ncbi:origin recognition complex, subunit 4 [Thozetella sp. PMI_491]|nr:origin recognition complex, subunit 4 [Thozetella sp. PMI_491]
MADQRATQQKDGEDGEDDEVCMICSKPDSKASNQILFCDSCDKAFHQKCYGVAFIPKGDWFCRECAPPEPAPTKDLVLEDQGLSERASLDDRAPEVPNFGHHLQAAQRVLLDRCTGRRRIKLRGQDDAYEKTSQLIEQTIVAGEGNSMLVIGSRGSGKTTLVESILADMSQSHKGEFHVVRLNGFIHTDDKLAVKAIWQQLGKELEEEEGQIGKANTYADTMAYLLSLLSHPSEYAEGQDGVTSQSVIFVIDEFDLFATHGRQTLLYNLLDYAQAKKAPIAVLGLTTRIDVVESLEKRVKSRFSHRYVYLSQAKSVPAFWDMCKQGLTIADEDMGAEGIDATVEGHAQFWEWWNQRIDTLYKMQSFRDHLEFHFYSTKSVPAFLTTCILPLSSLSPRSLALAIPSDTFALEPPDSNLHVLESLSDLDLALLICAARLDIIAHTDTVNFAMAYDEYTALMGKLRVQTAASGMLAAGGQGRVWGRGVAAIAWERLIDLGLLLPAGVGARGAAAQAGAEGKMWKVDMVLEEIPGAAELNSVLTRWCKEI